MTKSENYYERLGIEPDATPEEIKKAYIDKCYIFHPDRMTGAPESARKKAEEELKKINEAYEVLQRKEKKTSYTRSRPPIKPIPVVRPSHIRFSDMEPGQIKKASFVIDNTGGPYSDIRLINNVPWLKIVNSDPSISAGKLPLEIKIEAKGSDWGKTSTEHIKVRLDDEEALVTVGLQMKPKPNKINEETGQSKRVNKSRRMKPSKVQVIALSCVLLFLIVGLTVFLAGRTDTTVDKERTISTPNMAQVKDGNIVQVNYTGTLADGTVFDTSVGKTPLEFTLGSGQVISGFEKAVLGMKVGEKKTVTIPANEAYGPYRNELVLEVSRDKLPTSITPEVGLKLQQKEADGSVVIATITKVSDTTVILDANHPLAGKDLTFEIELVKIQ